MNWREWLQRDFSLCQEDGDFKACCFVASLLSAVAMVVCIIFGVP